MHRCESCAEKLWLRDYVRLADHLTRAAKKAEQLYKDLVIRFENPGSG